MALSRITAASIADGTVVAADIADGAVTGPKLGATSINANNIVDSSITSAKIVSVANTQITGNITSSQIVPNPTFNGNTTVTNLIVGAGSNTAPSITPTGDTNTGIYFPAADNIAITTGGTARLNVDGSGRVTTPTQPFFLAERSGNQTGYDAGSLLDVVVIYNLATTNIGSHYNTSTGKFTAPVAGVYAFYAGAYAALQSFNQSWLVINGSRANYTDWAGSASEFQQGFWIVRLAANDTVGYHPYAAGQTNVTINENPSHTYFYGHLLG